jgi:hypothetical protein
MSELSRLSSDRDGAVVLWRLALSVPGEKDQAGEHDISTSQKVRILRTRPVLYCAVTGPEQTRLNSNADDTADLEDDVGERTSHASRRANRSGQLCFREMGERREAGCREWMGEERTRWREAGGVYLQWEGLDDGGVHADEDDHAASGTDYLAGKHELPVVGTGTTIREGEEH